MIEKLTFATSNQGKVDEVSAILELPIEFAHIKVDEVQSENLDLEYVAKRKVESVFDQLKKPVFVDDVSLELEEWNGLPGTDVKTWLARLKLSEILSRLQYMKNRNLIVKTAIGYHDGHETRVFIGELHGTLSTEVRGEDGFGFDFAIIPNGENQTLAEMGSQKKNQVSHRRKALDKFREYLESLEK